MSENELLVVMYSTPDGAVKGKAIIKKTAASHKLVD